MFSKILAGDCRVLVGMYPGVKGGESVVFQSPF